MKIKKRIWGIITLIIVIIFGVIMANRIQYENYLKEYNKSIFQIIGKIKEKYPEISDKEIIEILNNKNITVSQENEGKELLKKYAIKENDPAIINLQDVYNNNLVMNLFIAIFIILFFAIIYLINKYKERKEIEKIIEYIREINNKNYELKIEKNEEDELTNLRNELYKITLMLKEQAENSELDKKNLARNLSDISHQIKTPLTSISIMLDEIKENPNMDDETRQKFIYEISRQVEQIKFLALTLLKFSKLDAYAVEFENKKINLAELVNEAVRNLEIPIEIKNQNIENKIDSNIYIRGDYRWILEAIMNIIKNCIEHTNEGKNIYLQSRKTNMYVELIIQDEGEGISEDDLKHIFERFYKGKNSSSDSFGIGLSLSKTILEKQNATITCLSKEREGTTFKIRFF